MTAGFLWPVVLLLLAPWLAGAWLLARREEAARRASLARLGVPEVLARAGMRGDAHARRRALLLRGLAGALAIVAL
ncbi:MAG: hypothetical protein MUC69_11820, partial [Gemmatimonadales bacterium]|nr:hypothetical protein [Gemmatimonadales bacterium]